MTILKLPITQPSDFDTTQFVVDATTKKFKIRPVSSDSGNVLSAGTDGRANLTAAAVQAAQVTYSMSLDTSTAGDPVLKHYRTVNGVTTLQDSIHTTAFDMTVTGGTFNSTSGVLTLTESNGGGTVTVNLGGFLTQVASANSQSIALSGSGAAGSPITASITLDPISGNLLKVTASGTKVDPADVLALLNANTSHTLALDTTNGVFTSTVNGKAATLNLTQLTDTQGNALGYLFTGT